MPPKAKAAGGKGRGPAKRQLAEEFPPGETLTDNAKKAWKLGSPIGQGGFGLLYLADENKPGKVGCDAPYVIKVEPSENGPLFSELKFYMRAAKPDLLQDWTKSHKLKYLGIPRYWGSGLHDKGGKRYRFMVMDRFGTDLQKKFEESGKRFSRKLVLQLGLKLMDILEYIHEHEYVHADIKASNLLLSHANPNQVYLVDYGLAYRYSPEGVLKVYKEDPKKCHDGTIEFTSIDAHKGVSPCRRGDLEILAYCMVQWLCGRLPWEDKLQDPIYVKDCKIKCRENISGFMSKCFPSSQTRPEELQRFMEEVKGLGYTDKPDYQKLRSFLQAGLKSIGAKDVEKLDFSTVANGAGPSSPAKTVKKRKAADDVGGDGLGDGANSPAKKKSVAKKVVKKATSPKKPKVPKVLSPKKPVPARLGVEMGTQTSPGLNGSLNGRKPRGRPKKNA